MREFFKYLLVITGLVAIGFILWYAKTIIFYIIISAILSLFGRPVVDFLGKLKYKRIRLPVSLRAGLTLMLLWAVLSVFFIIFIPLITKQAKELSNVDVAKVVKNLETPIQSIENIFGNQKVIDSENFTVQEYAKEKVKSILSISDLSNIVTFSAKMLGDIFIAFFSISFISFFFLKNDKLINNAILAIVPNRYVDETQHILKSIHRLLKRYFIGVLIEVLLVSSMVTIGLLIIGLSLGQVLLIATFVGVLNVIPYLGPVFGGLFGLFMGLVTHINMEFYTELLPILGLMALVFLIVQLIDNAVIQPFIYSNSVNAHPLEIFLVIMIAGNLAGVTGMVLAIPSYTILRVIAKEFFDGTKLIRELTQNI